LGSKSDKSSVKISESEEEHLSEMFPEYKNSFPINYFKIIGGKFDHKPVVSPYLPVKNKNASEYGLILGLDEVLIHY